MSSYIKEQAGSCVNFGSHRVVCFEDELVRISEGPAGKDHNVAPTQEITKCTPSCSLSGDRPYAWIQP